MQIIWINSSILVILLTLGKEVLVILINMQILHFSLCFHDNYTIKKK